jgi:hypothetical protein
VCPSCTLRLLVPAGMTRIETIWLHESECADANAFAFA